MTVCATEALANDSRTARHTSFTIAADGSYAARLNASAEGGWYPERWTLDGPEPYAVPLPGSRPEEAHSQVLPLTDGRVLIARRDAGHQRVALLYPTGPGTGELSLGAVESERFTLLPPAPCGQRAYALTPREHSTGVWLVAGSDDGGPQLVAQVSGHCTGGAWLDREGRLLALDRTDTAGNGRTKTVAVDLARGGEVSPLLQITEDSDDRLLLADPDSGLLLVRSNAPGEPRLGWGVLGSHRPIRFPESLHPEGALLTPFSVQPGQMLLPESCAVALRGQPLGAAGGGSWLGVWRPMQKELRRFLAPGGWLLGKGVWTREGELRLPCATPHVPCGVARLRMRGASAGGDARATVAGTGVVVGGGAPQEGERLSGREPQPRAALLPGPLPVPAPAGPLPDESLPDESPGPSGDGPQEGPADGARPADGPPSNGSLPEETPPVTGAAARPRAEQPPTHRGPRKPVPLQNAPLATDLRSEVLPTRTS